MKKIQLFLIGLLALTGLRAQQVNDANAERREVAPFHAISLSSSFDVYLTQGNEEAVAVSASEKKHRDRIKVEVKDGVLYVGYDSEGFRWSSGNKKLKAYISFKQVDKITVSGACDVFTSGSIKADHLDIRLSGASDMKTKLDVGRLTVDLNGASDMTVSGTATQLTVEASGASDFKGFELVTDTCNAQASGASDIRITVNKELSAQATGASDVRYLGTGVIKDLKSSGASSISKG